MARLNLVLAALLGLLLVVAVSALPAADDLEDMVRLEMDAEPSASPEEVDDAEDDDDVCFPADARVNVADGSSKRMDELTVGDLVEVSKGTYSPVFMFTHQTTDTTYDFVSVTTSTGATLRLTPGHYLYVNGALAAAKTVAVGDTLELASGSLDTVHAIASVKGLGLYNPQTVAGDIIVDGVRASTYTTTVEPAFAHAALAPVRALYSAMGWYTELLKDGSSLAAILPSGAATA